MVKNRVFREYKENELDIIYVNGKQYMPFDAFKHIYEIDTFISHNGKLYGRPMTLRELGHKKAEKPNKNYRNSSERHAS